MEGVLMGTETLFIWAVAIVLFLVFAIPFIWKKRNLEVQTDRAELEALRYGLKEPVSLQPVVNPDICIGSGSCVAACPEEDVLGLRNGQAVTVSPARCVGHGLCERSCPVNAIQLVFGSEKRGVDIPRIRENFETNVSGIFIIGELGGMGLIRNAFMQGQQCIEYITREKKPARQDLLDAVIVGCGPAGLSATIHASLHNMNTVTLEQEDIGGSVRNYPRRKVVMTHPITIPGYGKIHRNEILKEELITLWEDIVKSLGLHVQTNQQVENIEQLAGNAFRVKTADQDYLSRRVILAIGRRGTPRKLGIEGEELPNVAYSLREPDQFRHMNITVVGGGDSAIEAALALSREPGNRVRISYRREAFFRIKSANMSRLEEAAANGSIEVLYNTEVVKNAEHEITIANNTGPVMVFENDYLFIFAGGTLPMELLKKVGVMIDTKFGEP